VEPGTFYHYFNRGNNRENIFKEDANYKHFLKLMKKYLLSVTDVYSYCLLPNHFHLIIRTKELDQLPEAYQNGKRKLWQPFSNLFNAYAKAFNKKYGRSGSLFQKVPKQIIIENQTYLRNLIVYVNTNSAHHGIADYYEYPYSSYPVLISDERTSLKREEVLEMFSDQENFESVLEKKEQQIELSQQLLLEDD